MLSFIVVSFVNISTLFLPANPLYHLFQDGFVSTLGEAVALGASGAGIWDSSCVAQWTVSYVDRK